MERTLTPQQEAFLSFYINPKSPTWGNARQSALKADYSSEYAGNITALMPKWLDEALEDSKLVGKAMKNLSEFIGDDENVNIKWDATKFTLSRLAKGKFSERTEQTGADGKDLQITIIKYADPSQIQS